MTVAFLYSLSIYVIPIQYPYTLSNHIWSNFISIKAKVNFNIVILLNINNKKACSRILCILSLPMTQPLIIGRRDFDASNTINYTNHWA